VQRGFDCYDFTDEAGGRAIGRELTAALTASCDVDELASRAIRTCLDELLDNVVHHADARNGGFATARGWRKPARFEVAIVDLGIGIRRSLTKNPAYASADDDMAAVRKAVELGVTSTPHRNSGYGLAVTRDLLDKNHGLLVIKSGWAELWLGSEEEEVRADAPFPGTLVGLRARTNRPLNVTEVYRSLLGELDDE
jgi:anti-sigma regulatory factor (Ser/Thr protein kinase)